MRAWAAARSASVGWESMSVVKVSWVALLVNKLGGRLGGDGWTDGGLSWGLPYRAETRDMLVRRPWLLFELFALTLSTPLSLLLYMLCAFSRNRFGCLDSDAGQWRGDGSLSGGLSFAVR